MDQSAINDKPLTFGQFVDFFDRFIEPRFSGIETQITYFHSKFEQVDQRFDDLYKKFEDLQQEYSFSNEQIKRLTYGFENFRGAFADFCQKVAPHK